MTRSIAAPHRAAVWPLRALMVPALLRLLAACGGAAAAPPTVDAPVPRLDVASRAGGLGGSGSGSRFSYPHGVAVDAAGNVYVTDTGNHTIRKVTPAGAVTTLAGLAKQKGSANGRGGEARFYAPTGIAVDAAGNVYVADALNHTIRKITPAGVVTTLAGQAGASGSADGTGGAARLFNPLSVALDAAGNVYVADTGNYTIRKITPAGAVTTLAGLARQSGDADGAGRAARFCSPYGVALDAAGTVYVADWGCATIRKVTLAGDVTTVAGRAEPRDSTARFDGPSGVAVDVAGNVYFADSETQTIRKITSGGVVTTLAGQVRVSGSADGAGSAARFNRPTSVAVDAAGNVYVADSWNHAIRKVTPAGVVTTLAGLAGVRGSADGARSAASFNGANGAAVDAAGEVYAADTFDRLARTVTPAGPGRIVLLVGNEAAVLTAPVP